jgi:hypothetical protein
MEKDNVPALAAQTATVVIRSAHQTPERAGVSLYPSHF